MSAPRIPILHVAGCLLVTVQLDLKDTLADAFQEDLLQELARSGAEGLVVDISALDFVDSYVARVLAETGKMAHLMGAATVLVGMRPTVAATLVRMGFRMEGVETALNVDAGLALIARLTRPAPAPTGGAKAEAPNANTNAKASGGEGGA